MKKLIFLFAVVLLISSCNEKTTSEKNNNSDSTKTSGMNIKEDAVSYSIDGVNYKGYITYDNSNTNKRPAVLVIPEWWGLTEYPRKRAKQLAELGYIAMAVDMYGEGKVVDDPKSAQDLATPFYNDPTLTKKRFDPAIEKLKSYSQTDSSKIA